MKEGESALLRAAKPLLLPYLFLTAALLPSLLHAEEFHLYPSIAQKLEYTDNLLITPTQQLHDFISTTSGGLQLLTKTEMMNLDVSARVDELLHKDNPGLDSTDQFYKAYLGLVPSDKFRFTLRGTFNRDSRADREFYTSGVVLNAQKRVLQRGIHVDLRLYREDFDLS